LLFKAVKNSFSEIVIAVNLSNKQSLKRNKKITANNKKIIAGEKIKLTIIQPIATCFSQYKILKIENKNK